MAEPDLSNQDIPDELPAYELRVRLALAQQDVAFYAEQVLANRVLLSQAFASFTAAAAAAAMLQSRLALSTVH